MEEKDRLQMIIDRALRFLRQTDDDAASRMVFADFSEGIRLCHLREFIAHVIGLLEGVEK